MAGESSERRDYDTNVGRMRTTYQNSMFQGNFGRNDFELIGKESRKSMQKP